MSQQKTALNPAQSRNTARNKRIAVMVFVPVSLAVLFLSLNLLAH